MTPVRLLVIAFALALIWGAYWVVSARATHSALVTWMEDRRDSGWQAEWSDITMRGFPSRLDRTIHDLVLADPDSGWAWETPAFQILGLTYVQDQIILVWPPEQRILTPREKMTLTNAEMRGSLTLIREEDAVDNAAFVFRDMGLVSDQGWAWAVDEFRLGLRSTAGRAGWVDIGIEALGLTPPKSALGLLRRTDLAPDRVERVSADIAVELDAPLSRVSLETERPQPRALNIREIRAVWGELDLAVAGDLDIDAGGKPRGDIQIRARNWQDMVALAEESGALPKAATVTLRAALEGASRLAGRPETLDIVIQFRSGRTWLGPLPLGPAPRLVLP